MHQRTGLRPLSAIAQGPGLRETGRCPFLGSRPADTRTLPGTSGFTGLRRLGLGRCFGLLGADLLVGIVTLVFFGVLLSP